MVACQPRFGVIVSSGIGGLKTLQDQHNILLTKGPSRNSPFTIPMLISNMASGLISMEYGLRGPNMCIVTACATSNNAIGESWRIIKFGDADIFLAGGSEASVVAIGLAGFSAMKALSTRNDEPEHASRPFDRDRDGFVMSEGAGIVVVEELEHAKARGAKIYCELTGYGLSADAYHMTAPPADGDGAVRAFAKRLVGESALAEDLVHEVFVRLPRAIRRLRPGTTLEGFLIAVALNHARHHIRSAARRRRAQTRLAQEPPRSPGSAPDEELERRRLALALSGALDRLPIDQRIAFVLCAVEERTSADAAALAGTNESTMRARLFHARRRLREHLAGYHDGGCS